MAAAKKTFPDDLVISDLPFKARRQANEGKRRRQSKEAAAADAAAAASASGVQPTYTYR